jgi:hypothetical protein
MLALVNMYPLQGRLAHQRNVDGIMLGWFQRLLPREQKFVPLFERHAAAIAAAAEALRRMLDGGDQVALFSELF